MEIGRHGALGAPVRHLVMEGLLPVTGLETGVVLIQLQNLEESHALESVKKRNVVILTSDAQVRV